MRIRLIGLIILIFGFFFQAYAQDIYSEKPLTSELDWLHVGGVGPALSRCHVDESSILVCDSNSLLAHVLCEEEGQSAVAAQIKKNVLTCPLVAKDFGFERRIQLALFSVDGKMSRWQVRHVSLAQNQKKLEKELMADQHRPPLIDHQSYGFYSVFMSRVAAFPSFGVQAEWGSLYLSRFLGESYLIIDGARLLGQQPTGVWSAAFRSLPLKINQHSLGAEFVFGRTFRNESLFYSESYFRHAWSSRWKNIRWDNRIGFIWPAVYQLQRNWRASSGLMVGPFWRWISFSLMGDLYIEKWQSNDLVVSDFEQFGLGLRLGVSVGRSSL